MERPGSKGYGIVLYDKSKGMDNNGPCEDKSTGDRDRFRASFEDDTIVFCFENGLMVVVFTEKYNTKRVADLEGKLQSSVLDMLSLR